MGSKVSLDKEKMKQLRTQAEQLNPAYMFLQCLTSHWTIDEDQEPEELADQENVVKGARYIRTGGNSPEK